MSNASFNKILLVNPFGIGDAIFSMYLVEAIKKKLPQSSIGFLGNERTIGLLRMNRSIDACHEFNRDAFRALLRKNAVDFVLKTLRLAKEIKKERYDTVFDLSLGREFGFAAACLGIGQRIGFDFKNRGFWLTRKMKLEAYEKKHVVDWQLGLLASLGLQPPPLSSRLPLIVSSKAKKNAADFLTDHQVVGNASFFAVAPGGGKSWGRNATYKQWAPERFAEVAGRQAEKNNWRVVILGDAEERPLLERLKTALSVPTVIAAGLELETVSAILERSQFLLCNDGGLLHLANALGVRTVSVYGPVDEKVYGPYGVDSKHQTLTQDVPCRPCYAKFHFPPCGHQKRCLEELSVEKVLAAVGKIS